MPASAKKQAWRKIAKAFEEYANGAPDTDITFSGLCRAVKRSTDPLLRVQMMRQLLRPDYDSAGYGPAIDEQWDSFWWPLNREGAAQRAIFATLMAEVS